MFEYTQLILKKTINDIKRVYYICTLSTQVLYIAYLFYAVISASGTFITNLIMLIASSAYFVFFCLTLSYEKLKKNKKGEV